MSYNSTRSKILIGLFLLAILICSVNRLKESDSFYHLRTGQLIWQTEHIPTADVYSYTAPGAPWVPHEWLAQVIFYGAYSLGGFWGLILFIACLASLTYFLLLRLSLKLGGDLPVSILVLLIFGYLTLELWIPRPQSIAFLLCATLLFSIISYRLSGNKKWLIVSSLAIWFWANVNASVVLGLLILFGFAMAAFLSTRFPRWLGPVWPEKSARFLGLASLVAFCLSFVSPASYRSLTYIFTIRSTTGMIKVMEWLPLTNFLASRREAPIFLCEIIIAALFAVWYFGYRQESRDLSILGLILAVTAMPFVSIRHVAWWPLTTLPFFAVALSKATNDLRSKFSADRILALAIFFCLLFLGLRSAAFPDNYYNPATIPSSAVDFLENNSIPGPILNLYNEGGYLIWRLWPREKVFIDGRSEVYGSKQIHDLITVSSASPGWDKIINDKYHVNVVFLGFYAVQPLTDSIRPLVNHLRAAGWQLVYWDDAALVYLRPSRENEALLKKYALKIVDPFVDPVNIPVQDIPVARQELFSLLNQTSTSIQVLSYARSFALAHPKVSTTTVPLAK